MVDIGASQRGDVSRARQGQKRRAGVEDLAKGRGRTVNTGAANDSGGDSQSESESVESEKQSGDGCVIEGWKVKMLAELKSESDPAYQRGFQAKRYSHMFA